MPPSWTTAPLAVTHPAAHAAHLQKEAAAAEEPAAAAEAAANGEEKKKKKKKREAEEEPAAAEGGAEDGEKKVRCLPCLLARSARLHDCCGWCCCMCAHAFAELGAAMPAQLLTPWPPLHAYRCAEEEKEEDGQVKPQRLTAAPTRSFLLSPLLLLFLFPAHLSPTAPQLLFVALVGGWLLPVPAFPLL